MTVIANAAEEIPLKDLKNSNDEIKITVEENKVGTDEVEFVLKIAPKITWHKKLKAFSGTGFMGEVEVRDDIKEAKLSLKVDKLDRVEIGKAGKMYPFTARERVDLKMTFARLGEYATPHSCRMTI